jgi:hypothetical protein
MLVDSYLLYRNDSKARASVIDSKERPGLTEEKERYIIFCDNDLKISIDKTTGLLSSFAGSDEEHLISGPWLNLRTMGNERISASHHINDYGVGWKLRSVSVRKAEEMVEVMITGDYEGIRDVTFKVNVMADGSILTDCKLKNMPEELIRELGVKYMFENIFDTLSWRRDAYWSFYPEGHLSAPEGKVQLYANNVNRYREAPIKDWQFDTKSFFYNGTDDETPDLLTNISRATKENIFEYNLLMGEAGKISVMGSGSESCRIDRHSGNIWLYVSNMIDYPDLSWGNYQRNITLRGTQTLKSRMRISLF